MTTAAVVAYYSQESEVRISYAGHPPVLYKRASEAVWSYVRPFRLKGRNGEFPLNLPLATDMVTRYTETSIPILPGDRFFIYKDGILDTPDPLGRPFGLSRLKRVLDEHADAPLSALKSAILRRLGQYAGCKLDHDDVTLMALEIC